MNQQAGVLDFWTINNDRLAEIVNPLSDLFVSHSLEPRMGGEDIQRKNLFGTWPGGIEDYTYGQSLPSEGWPGCVDLESLTHWSWDNRPAITFTHDYVQLGFLPPPSENSERFS